MELNQDDIELLDRYFRNELTSEELTVLQSKMKSAEFSTAAKFHFESLSVVQSAGREELLLSLSAIQKNIEQQNGFEKYKASKSKKGGSNGGGFMVVVVAGIVAVAVYLFSTGKLDEEHIKSTFHKRKKSILFITTT